MRLEGKQVSVDQVQQLVSLDPERGCSIQSLAEAAEQLGFPVEVRFVNPRDVIRIPRPFIFHGLSSIKKDTGHYVLAVEYDVKNDLFHMINPVRERYGRSPRDSLLRGFSGYVLVPKYPAKEKWNWIAGISLVIAGVCSLGCVLYSVVLR
jgi:ABC-type bacteriocin/lantibiotic exporter with double-glycine peptidase domain